MCGGNCKAQRGQVFWTQWHKWQGKNVNLGPASVPWLCLLHYNYTGSFFHIRILWFLWKLFFILFLWRNEFHSFCRLETFKLKIFSNPHILYWQVFLMGCTGFFLKNQHPCFVPDFSPRSNLFNSRFSQLEKQCCLCWRKKFLQFKLCWENSW